MNKRASVAADTAQRLVKPDPGSPVFKVTGSSAIVIKAGTIFAGHRFTDDTPVSLHLNEKGEPGYIAGADYEVHVRDGEVSIARTTIIPHGDILLGGFHFAPGGNATARSGGDTVPAINPCSLWDINFRPACPDPRGMALVDVPGRTFWADIYLLGVNHVGDGTSKFGVLIADGDDPPLKPAGGTFKKLDYDTAVAVMKHHRKGLLGPEEFFAAAYGVTEKSSCRDDPKVTGLDAPRTSKFGLMQATGNLWAWGHDGDPYMPRASMFGGSWYSGGYAGSRCAYVACNWPDNSGGHIGARGRGDHLQLA